MEEKRDNLGKLIKEELEREAARTEEALDGAKKMPAEAKERVRANLQEQIARYEEEQRYEYLSEDEKEALRIGKEVLEGRKRRSQRGSWKKYLLLAAAVGLVAAMGITSFGGAERLAHLVKSAVGEREVVKINSSEDNLIIVQEDEEKAYQTLEEVFGTEPVKIIWKPQNMQFQKMEIDEELQMADLSYECGGKKLVYWMNASYSTSSWGVDVEDQILDQFSVENEYCTEIEVTEYEVAQTGEKKYVAKYSYMGMDYLLVGVVEREEMEEILKNLRFIA